MVYSENSRAMSGTQNLCFRMTYISLGGKILWLFWNKGSSRGAVYKFNRLLNYDSHVAVVFVLWSQFYCISYIHSWSMHEKRANSGPQIKAVRPSLNGHASNLTLSRIRIPLRKSTHCRKDIFLNAKSQGNLLNYKNLNPGVSLYIRTSKVQVDTFFIEPWTEPEK